MSLYDPKLRDAAEEFKAICLKYDCVGVCLFVSPTHSEFVHQISPTWSVMRVEHHADGTSGIRVRSLREEFDSDESQRHATESTVHALTSIIEWSRQLNGIARTIIESISKTCKVAWKTWDKPDAVPIYQPEDSGA